MAKPKKVLIQLRVTPDQRDELKEAGWASGRSLPNEILYRLGFEEDGGTERASADLAAVIAGRAVSSVISAAKIPRGVQVFDITDRVLSVIRDALVLTLNDLGANRETIRKAGIPIAETIAREVTALVKQPLEDWAAPTPEDRVLERVGKALGFRETEDREDGGTANEGESK